MISPDQIRQALGENASVYEASVCEADGATWFLARRDGQRRIGTVGPGPIEGQPAGEIDGQTVTLAPASAATAAALRQGLPWTAPKLLGQVTTVGLGDRLGLATPGHVRAVRDTGVAPVFAQQSIREMTRTGRSPQQVMDDATLGVFQEGWREGFGADADHVQEPQDVTATAAAGFRFFTIDPGRHVENAADGLDPQRLLLKYGQLDFDSLETSPRDFVVGYQGKSFLLSGGGKIRFPGLTAQRAAVKYGRAIAHAAAMCRQVQSVVDDDFELEVSVDETDSPTSPAEHYFIASELKRLGVEWISLAPRFVGRFEKGVDYIGDKEGFAESFGRHVAVMRTLGPYKMSVHSGSDKFGIYEIVAELTDGLVHVKTAGTSYLEALRVLAACEEELFRAILDFAREHYQADRATYHVSADLDRVPASADLSAEQLPGLLDDFHARQVLHVTYGSVLTEAEGTRFGQPLRQALREHEEAYADGLAVHLGKHLDPFAR